MREVLSSALILLAAVITAQAHASLVFAHSGNSDPATEGWSVEASFAACGRPTTSAVSNVQHSGYDAWSIDDNLTTIGSNWTYAQTATTVANYLARAAGWTLRTLPRLSDAPDAAGNAGAVMLEYGNSLTDYRLALGAEADGAPIVLLRDGGVTDGGIVVTGTSFTLQGGCADFHLYEMIYYPGADSVDLLIDGVECIRNYAGCNNPIFNRIAWGSGNNSDTGQSNRILVEWQVLTVPLQPVSFSSWLAMP